MCVEIGFVQSGGSKQELPLCEGRGYAVGGLECIIFVITACSDEALDRTGELVISNSGGSVCDQREEQLLLLGHKAFDLVVLQGALAPLQIC